MAISKYDMARVVVQALYNFDVLPRADYRPVLKMARKSKSEVEASYRLAAKILSDRTESRSLQMAPPVYKGGAAEWFLNNASPATTPVAYAHIWEV